MNINNIRKPLYFSSPAESIVITTALLRRGNWPELARYYDLSRSDIPASDLYSGKFFYRTEKPEMAHPAGFWRYKHPFAPGFIFDGTYKQSEDVTVVRVAVKIDQGDGMVQKSYQAYGLKSTPNGFQILPDHFSPFPDAP